MYRNVLLYSMELLTVHEAALLLKVNPITVRRYIADGRLSAVRAGKGVRVLRESLDQFIEPIEPKGHYDVAMSKTKPLTKSDSLFRMVGIAHSPKASGLSENKYVAFSGES